MVDADFEARSLARAIQWLEPLSACVPVSMEEDPLGSRLQARAREELEANDARWVAHLLEMRPRGRAKFPQADRMFFARRWLEQASSENIAAYKARRLTDGATGQVWDICCGVGGDLLELARLQPLRTRGVDLDPRALVLAEANCRALRRDAELLQLDAADARPSADDVLHVDPDRRARQRTVCWGALQPSPDVLTRLTAAVSRAAVKLAPATRPPADWLSSAEQEWIGEHREVKQQVLWIGRDQAEWAARGLRRATVVHQDGRCSSLLQVEHGPVERAREPAAFLWDPRPAVRCAGLIESLAFRHGAQVLEGSGEYLTSQQPLPSGLAASFEVLQCEALDPRRLKQALAVHQPRDVEVKTRGVNVDPRRILSLVRRGSGPPLTVFVFALGRSHRIVLARRCIGEAWPDERAAHASSE